MPEVRERGTRWSIALLFDLGERIVATAREYLGVPFVHTGRSREFGVDCIGLLVCVARELGLTEHDDRNYGRQVDPEHLRRALLRFCAVVPPEAPLVPGDIVVFAIKGHPTHIGIYTERETIIHAWEVVQKVVEQPLYPFWSPRVAAVFRWTRPAEGAGWRES